MTLQKIVSKYLKLREVKLDMIDMAVLATVQAAGRAPITIMQVVERTQGSGRATLHKRVTKLVKMKLLTLEASTQDGRTKFVSLGSLFPDLEEILQ